MMLTEIFVNIGEEVFFGPSFEMADKTVFSDAQPNRLKFQLTRNISHKIAI